MCMYSPAAKLIINKSFLRVGLSECPDSLIPILKASTSDKYTVSAFSEIQLLHLFFN